MAGFWDRYARDPAFAEGVDEVARSLAETSCYVFRSPGDAPAEPCEACGMPVVAGQEANFTVDRDAWHPAAWEAGPGGGRHTPRRCAWSREHQERTA
jgi:hypothetical protein